MYTAYKLNKQGDNIQPWRTPFLIWNQSVAPCPVNCCFLTWIQISQEGSKVIWYSHLFQNFPQFGVIHTVKGFNIVNEAEIDLFLKFSWFFYDSTAVCNLISGSSTFSKSSLIICKFSVHILLKPSLENFEHYFASVWNECNCGAVWTFFGIALLWHWNENWPFPVLRPLLSFKPAFSLSSLTFIKRLFVSFLFSAIRVLSSVYLRLLIFLLAVLIPACASSSSAFCIMYSE